MTCDMFDFKNCFLRKNRFVAGMFEISQLMFMSFLWQWNNYRDFVTFDTVKLRNNTKKNWHFWWVHCKHVSDWLSPPEITKCIFGDSACRVHKMAHKKEFKNRWRDWQCKKFKYLKKRCAHVSHDVWPKMVWSFQSQHHFNVSSLESEKSLVVNFVRCYSFPFLSMINFKDHH